MGKVALHLHETSTLERDPKAYENAGDYLDQFDFFTEPPLLESVTNLSGFPW